MFRLGKILRNLDKGDFDSNEIQNFNPDAGIWNETNAERQMRGVWDMPEGGERVNLSFIIKNNTNSTIYLELFNAERTVAHTYNPLYTKNATIRQYTPHSEWRTIFEMAELSAAALAGTVIGVTCDPHCFVNSTGDYLFCSDRTYAFMRSTYLNVQANGIAATGTIDQTIPDAYITCNEVPYASLIADMNSGLVIDINQMRIQTSVTSFFNGTIDVQRWQSFGGSQTNPLPWSIGRSPLNNLTDTIDIMKRVIVDKKTSMNLRLPALAEVNITVFGTGYRNNGIEWA